MGGSSSNTSGRGGGDASRRSTGDESEEGVAGTPPGDGGEAGWAPQSHPLRQR